MRQFTWYKTLIASYNCYLSVMFIAVWNTNGNKNLRHRWKAATWPPTKILTEAALGFYQYKWIARYFGHHSIFIFYYHSASHKSDISDRNLLYMLQQKCSLQNSHIRLVDPNVQTGTFILCTISRRYFYLNRQFGVTQPFTIPFSRCCTWFWS